MRPSLHHQWANRPDDERFVSLADLAGALEERARQSVEVNVPLRDLSAVANGESLLLYVSNGGPRPLQPTAWAWRQLGGAINAPIDYLQSLPAPVAAQAVTYGLAHSPNYDRRLLVDQGGDRRVSILRAATSRNYGRILDYDVVRRVMDFAGDRWRVPGSGVGNEYRPARAVTKRSTTLYASDRDVWLFLIDDSEPVAIGKTFDGRDDLLFRGIVVRNSEVGASALHLSTFWLRGICDNRILWGVQNVETVNMRHSKRAPERYVSSIVPSLARLGDVRPDAILPSILEARAHAIDGDPVEWIVAHTGIPTRRAREAVRLHEAEEHAPVRTRWDVVNALTAYARDIPHQDKRAVYEDAAERLLV